MRRRGSAVPPAAHLRSLPKVELHVHLEGSVGPALLHRLGRRGGSRPVPASVRSLYRFSSFAGFLRAYGKICARLRTPGHLEAAVRDLGGRLRRERVIHAEVFFSPQVHQRNGMELGPLLEGLERGAAAVEAAGGPSLAFLADGVRQWGATSFSRLVEDLRRHPWPRLRGVGLGGDETAVPARAFAGACRAARDAGLAVVVHAGEVGPAASVSQALDWLHPRRIAHGIQASADPRLLRRLARERLPLDVCLTSNVRTGAVTGRDRHPLPVLLQGGAQVSLGTDDPALFRASLSGEFARAARLGLTAAELRELALNAVRGALLPPDRKRSLERHLQRAWNGLG